MQLPACLWWHCQLQTPDAYRKVKRRVKSCRGDRQHGIPWSRLVLLTVPPGAPELCLAGHVGTDDAQGLVTTNGNELWNRSQREARDHPVLWSHFINFKNFIYFRERKGGRKRGRETSMWGCLSRAPYWESGLQPRHVPWLGIELVTLWFSGQHSIHWATPARAMIPFYTWRHWGPRGGTCHVCFSRPHSMDHIQDRK